ncbi:MAG: hypothetical protein ACK40X_04380 [Armatimonadota bacterium]
MGDEKTMMFWTLAALTAILALARFMPLRKHVGVTQAIAVLVLRLFAVLVAVLLASPIFVSSNQTIVQPIRLAILVDASRSSNTSVRQQVIKRLKQMLQPHASSVLVWEFSDDLKPVTLDKLSEHAEGEESRLSEAILKAVETARPDELLVVTDSQDTAPQHGSKLIEMLRKSKTRLSAVLLPTNLPANLSISLSPTQSFLFAGEEANLTVQVRGERLKEGTTVQLRVWSANKLVLQTRLKIVNGTAQTVVPLSPEKPGWHRYRFEVLPIGDEIWTEDNAAEALVWQAPTKLRVLLVTGQPSFEFKFVKQAIESEPNFEWAAVTSLPDGTRYQQGLTNLLPASLTRLEPFHVVVALAPTNYDFGSAEGRFAWQFAQSGGGLLVTLSEPSVSTNGWRIFVPVPLTISRLPTTTQLSPVKGDILGERLTDLPPVDSAWSIQPQLKSFQTALQSNGKPVLVWWQEGLGKIAILGIEGTWRWVMEAAKKGEQPAIHRQFWRTLIRFLADPTKGVKSEILSSGIASSALKVPELPPSELTTLPSPERMKAWAKMTGGQILQSEDLASWLNSLEWTKKATVPMQQPLSATTLPYLLLIAALTAEWWLIRRNGLQ